MGVVPSGPWRRLEQGDQPPSLGDYEKVPWLYKYASLYRAFAQVNVPPPVVNAMTTAEAAAYLGVGLDDGEGGVVGAERDVNRERAEYLYALQAWQTADPETRGEPPTPPAPEAVRPNEELLHVLGGG